MKVDIQTFKVIPGNDIEKLAIKEYGNDLHLYGQQREGFVQGYLTSINEPIDWDKIFKEADAYLSKKHPIGKIIGYNHEMLFDHIKEKYPQIKNLK